jgi:hypothetical protein
VTVLTKAERAELVEAWIDYEMTNGDWSKSH